MSQMLRGKTYSCGCCRSKPGQEGSERAIDKRATRKLMDEQMPEWSEADEKYLHKDCVEGECSQAPKRVER